MAGRRSGRWNRVRWAVVITGTSRAEAGPYRLGLEISGEPAIVTEGLAKSYRHVPALAGVDLAVPPGSVFGLLGPNGAGKTTLVKILATLLPPDAGTARVAGFDVQREAARLRAHIGIAGQYAAVDDNLTGFENLEMVGLLYHLGRRRARDRADELLHHFDLADAGRKPVKSYSGGMRRRLDLAAALVARPPVIFLDEPTTGLDPRSRVALWETIEGRVAEGSTVLLTTQYLDEADRLADRIAVIDRGAVIAEGTSEELKQQVASERLEVVLEEGADPRGAVDALAAMADGHAPAIEGNLLTVPIGRRGGAMVEAVRRLDSAGVGIVDVTIRRPTLNDVFFTLTGHKAEEPTSEEAG
jgi:ABC-2 type transport system ATP-binding protein